MHEHLQLVAHLPFLIQLVPPLFSLSAATSPIISVQIPEVGIPRTGPGNGYEALGTRPQM